MAKENNFIDYYKEKLSKNTVITVGVVFYAGEGEDRKFSFLSLRGSQKKGEDIGLSFPPISFLLEDQEILEHKGEIELYMRECACSEIFNLFKSIFPFESIPKVDGGCEILSLAPLHNFKIVLFFSEVNENAYNTMKKKVNFMGKEELENNCNENIYMYMTLNKGRGEKNDRF